MKAIDVFRTFPILSAVRNIFRLTILAVILACFGGASWPAPQEKEQFQDTSSKKTAPKDAPKEVPRATTALTFYPEGFAVEEVLESMWRMGLHDTAVSYCESQQTLVDKQSDAYARWTMWLIRSLAQRAVQSPSVASSDKDTTDSEKSSDWDRLEQVAADFTEMNPPHSRIHWVGWQLALARLLHAQSALSIYLGNPADQQSRDEALQIVRTIDSLIESIEKKLRTDLELASGETNVQARKRSEQLTELSIELNLVRCEAMRVRGQGYELGSPDAIAAGNEMMEQAQRALQRMAPQWEGKPRIDLAKAGAFLLLDNPRQTLIVLQPHMQNSDPTVLRLSIPLAIQAALELKERDLAVRILTRFRSRSDWPEVALAEMQIALDEIASLPADSSVRQSRLQEVVDQRSKIGERFGAYWQRRAETLLVAVGKETKNANMPPVSNASIDLLVIEARQMLEASRLDEAIERLQKAASLAEQAGNGAKALELSTQAGVIARKDNRLVDGAMLLCDAGKKWKELPNAAPAHLMGAYSLSEVLKDATEDAAIQKKYVETLEEHLRLWPQGATTDQAARWLIQWWRAQKKWGNAFLVARSVGLYHEPSSDLLLESVILCGMSTHWENRTATDRLTFLKEANDWFVDRLNGSAATAIDKAKAPLNTRQKYLLTLSILLFQRLMLDVDQLELGLTIADAKLADRNSLLGGGKLPEGAGTETGDQIRLRMMAQLLEAITKGNVSDSIDLAKSFQQEANEFPFAGEVAWLTLLAAVDAVDQLPPSERSKYGPCLSTLYSIVVKSQDRWSNIEPANNRVRIFTALAKSWNGDLAASEVELEQLRQKEPRNAVVLRAIASVWEQGDGAKQKQAQATYRQLAGGSKPNQPLWLWAKYRSMQLERWSGESKKAADQAKLLLATKTVSSPVWKSRFQQFANSP